MNEPPSPDPGPSPVQGGTGMAAAFRLGGVGFSVLLMAWILVAFGTVLLGWRSFYTRDFLNFGYPLAWHLGGSLHSGELPLWNPFLLLGIPHLAQWNTMALYPPMMLASLLPMPWSINFFQIVHLALGSAGMWRLVRSTTIRPYQPSSGAGEAMAALSFGFGGLSLTALMWPNNMAALGWSPWVILGMIRAAHGCPGAFRTAAILTTAQLLTGAPEMILATWLVAVTAGATLDGSAENSSVTKLITRTRAVFLVFGSALLLSAIQLVPFLELLLHSHRNASYGGNDWSLDFKGLATFVLPWFRTAVDRDGVRFHESQQWLTSPYVGIWPLVFTIAAAWLDRRRFVRASLLLMAICTWLALGHNGGLLAVLNKLCPWFGWMRYPVKFLVPTLMMLPWLSGIGLNALLHEHRQVRRKQIFWCAVAPILGVLCLLAALGNFQEPPEGQADPSLRCFLMRAGTMMLGFIAWTAMTSTRVTQHAWLLPSALACLTCADLVEANRHIHPVAPSSLMQGTRIGQQTMRSVNEPVIIPKPLPGIGRVRVNGAGLSLLDKTMFSSAEAAVQIPRLALVLNTSLLEEIPKLDGFLSLYMPRPLEIIRRLDGESAANSKGMLDFLAVTHENRARQPWIWDARATNLPWARWVPRAELADDVTVLSRLFSSGFNPTETVFLPSEYGGLLESTTTQPKPGAKAAVRLIQCSASHWQLESSSETDGWIVLAQTFDTGWQAHLDGGRVPLQRANYTFQAVKVPAGQHSISLEYRPASFRLGAAITLAALLIWIFCSFRPAGSIPLFPTRSGNAPQTDGASD